MGNPNSKSTNNAVAANASYWLLAGIPYLMAKAYKSLIRWKPPKKDVAFKRVPLTILMAIHGGGYALWAEDHYGWFLMLSQNWRLFKGTADRQMQRLDVWYRLFTWLDAEVHHALWTPVLGPVSAFWVWFILFGPVCLAMTLWFLFKEPKEVNPEKIGKLNVSSDKVRDLKEKADMEEGAFLGASKSARNKPNILPESWRTSHTYCVGASRSGKTASVMLPLAMQDIERGHPVIFFDGKGDVEHLNVLLNHADKYGRLRDFRYFSLSEPQRSHSYNPLAFGNATQKKDKLIGAFTWTEEHYKKACEDALLTVILALEGTKLAYNLEDLYLCLTEPKAVHRVYELCKDESAKEHLQYFHQNFASITKDISGLIKDLGLIIKNDFWPLMDTYAPYIDLLKVIEEKKILYLVFNTQAYQDTAERLARLFLQDLRSASDYIQNKVPHQDRRFTPIYVDEFNSFAFDAFGDFMSKCGGAKFALTLAHQSLGQLNKRGEHFKDEILDNANIKIIMRQDSPAAIEEFVRMIGTHTRPEYTQQTEEVLLFDKRTTGIGTVKQVEAFNISPNVIRQLQPHEAVVLTKQPFQYDVVKLDTCDRAKLMPGKLDFALPSNPPRFPGYGIFLREFLRNAKN